MLGSLDKIRSLRPSMAWAMAWAMPWVLGILGFQGVQAGPSPRSFVLEKNPRVKAWIRVMEGEDAPRVHRAIQRGLPYQAMIEGILSKEGLPRELFFLPLIESGYQTQVASHAEAVGPWQFIGSTGNHYGLLTNYFVDERKDPVRSTRAAALYLRKLYERFQNWPLALAAYNAGEKRIEDAMKKGKTRSFWKLADRKWIPQETIDYVPKFMATVWVSQRLLKSKNGFLKRIEKYPELREVEVPSPIHLHTLSSLSGVPLQKLQNVNPHLHHGVTPPEKETYSIWVARSDYSQIQSILKNLKEHRIDGLVSRKYPSAHRTFFYEIKKGDTLERLAKRFRTTEEHLLRLNDWKESDSLKPGQKMRILTQTYLKPRAP